MCTKHINRLFMTTPFDADKLRRQAHDGVSCCSASNQRWVLRERPDFFWSAGARGRRLNLCPNLTSYSSHFAKHGRREPVTKTDSCHSVWRFSQALDVPSAKITVGRTRSDSTVHAQGRDRVVYIETSAQHKSL
jgi:hypothetical protein